MKWTAEEKAQISFIKKSSEEVLIKEKDDSGVPWLKRVFSLYQKMYGEPCTGCPGSIPYYIQQIKSYAMTTKEKKSKNTANRKFFFKDKIVITPFGTNMPYSNDNLTDKKAEELLRENPNRIDLFKKYPENWHDLLKSSTQFKIVELEEKLKNCTDIEELERWLEDEKAADIPRKTAISYIEKRLKELTEQPKEKEQEKKE